MKGLFLSLSIIAIFSFSACTKKPGSLKACFTFSKNPAKINDTIYLLNCSENYSKFRWLLNNASVIDSINKHNYFVPTSTGNYPFYLLAWGLNGTDTTGTAKTLTIN